MKYIRVFLSEYFQFLGVQFSIYLHRRVFVMIMWIFPIIWSYIIKEKNLLPLGKGAPLKGKNLLTKGSKFFHLRLAPFQNGSKHIPVQGRTYPIWVYSLDLEKLCALAGILIDECNKWFRVSEPWSFLVPGHINVYSCIGFILGEESVISSNIKLKKKQISKFRKFMSFTF